MSGIPSCSEPPQIIDQSRRETSFRDYRNDGTHIQLGEGDLNLIHPDLQANEHSTPLNPLQKLRQHSSPRATFDSEDRLDPPRCAEATRIKIIQRMERWVNDDGSNAARASIFWLHGGAGAGKSALAQTLAENFHRGQRLAATFFFFKNDPSRNVGNTLIPTLVEQLVRNFNGLSPFIEEKIHTNPDLFTKQHGTQIQELLVEPLLRLKPKKLSFRKFAGVLGKDAQGSRPWLIVIDGLNECQHPEVQCNLLRAIATAIPRIPYRLRFLITSRADPHIMHIFNHEHALKAVTADQYNLSDDPDADADIRTFLEQEFERIHRSHCLSGYLPPGWPDRSSINLLVERSSGHFIYAATVIRYIKSEQHRPHERLEVVLRPLPSRGQEPPYTQLDSLYSLIFQDIKDPHKLDKISLVLGIILLHNHTNLFEQASYSKCSTIEGILGMKPGEVILLLSPILSLVAITNKEVRILHASLFEYLLDANRCRHLVPFKPAQVHGLAAKYLLEEKIWKNRCTIFEFANFAYHCRFGDLDDALKDYLRNLEVPYPKCIETTLSRALGLTSLINSLRMIMSHFFRALSRDDFDRTGQYHEQYATKWISCLHSAIPGCDKRQNSIPPEPSANPINEPKVDKRVLKDKLDALLMEWKPKKPPTVGDTRVRDVRHTRSIEIEREHRVWSTFARASGSTTNSNAVSSLVFGQDFIYSYHFTTEKYPGDNTPILTLLIYAKYGNAYEFVRIVGYWNVVEAMRSCLQWAENFLFSDLFQKYGFPEGS